MTNVVLNKRMSLEKYCQLPAFLSGLSDAGRQLPWRSFTAENDQIVYERARHFVAYWRSRREAPRPVFVGKQSAPWIAVAYMEARAEGAVL